MTTRFAAPGMTPARGLAALRDQYYQLRHHWQRARAQRRKAARIARELHTYTDRELADLRLSRSDIPAIASGTFGRS